MSIMNPESQQYLTPEERIQMKRTLMFPEEFPKEFTDWLVDYNRANADPVTQQLGSSGFPRYLAADRTAVTVGSTTTETTLATITLPAKTVAQGGYLSLDLYFVAMCSDSSNAIAFNWKANGTTFSGVSISTTALDEVSRAGRLAHSLNNLGVYTSQFLERHLIFVATDTPHLAIASLDMSQDITLTLTAKWNSAGVQSFTKYLVSASVFNPIGL